LPILVPLTVKIDSRHVGLGKAETRKTRRNPRVKQVAQSPEKLGTARRGLPTCAALEPNRQSCRARPNRAAVSIKFRRAGQTGLATAFDKRMREFKGESGGAKFRKIISKLRIDQRHGGGCGLETWWWSRTMTSTPLSRSHKIVSTAVEPQSTASRSLTGNFFRQFSTPSRLKP